MNKIRGNVVGTTQRPEAVLERATSLTEEQKINSRANVGAASAKEVEDVRRGFDGTIYETAGDAVRSQGVKIEVTPYENVGKNVLKEASWTTLPECEITSDENGIFTVVHNGRYGEYLEQIKESTITPHVGYYVNSNYDVLTDEVPDEAKYLTDAVFNSAAFVKGSAPFAYNLTPAAVLDLDHATMIGAVELTCRMHAGIGQQVPNNFDIQVKTLTGEWQSVKRVTSNPFIGDSGTVKYTFDPVVATNVRVLIYSYTDDLPAILEIGVYEVKHGRILEKIEPIDITTTAQAATGNAVDVVIDENKFSNFQTFKFPAVFTFDLARSNEDPITVSRLKICAYKSNENAPKNIIVEGLINPDKDEWTNIYGKAPAYAAGLTDTFVLDFNKDYEVYALRLSVTSPIGANLLVMNEVEIYGPAKDATHTKNRIGIFYNEYDANVTQRAGDIWYFGVKVACAEYDSANPPDIILGVDIAGDTDEVAVSRPKDNRFADYYRTFRIPTTYPGSFTNLKVCARYDDSVVDHVCKFSDFVLVNLTKTYGSGNEPIASAYHEARKSLKMSIHTADGVERYSLSGGKSGGSGDGKSAYDYAVEAGYTGSESEFAQKLIKEFAPSGYGFGETYARYPDNNDLNNATTTGVYRVTESTLHSPSENTLLVLTLADGSCKYQMAYERKSVNVYVRCYDWSENWWTNWVKIGEYAVQYTMQSLTPEQQARARANIGAASVNDIPTGNGGAQVQIITWEADD